MVRRIPASILVLALLAGVFVLGVVPAASATTVLVVDDDGLAVAGDCDSVTATHATIQSAVDAALPDDVVRVCPGLYAESVTVPQETFRLRILGANDGVDARTRNVGAENESIVEPPFGTAGFSLLASNGVVDGFTIKGAEESPGIYTSPDRTRYKVQNNIISNNAFGLYVHSSGFENTFVKYNRFVKNNKPGAAPGNAIYTDQGLEDILIRANTFRGHSSAAIQLAHVEGVTNANVLIRNNESFNDASFVDLMSGSNVRIIGNETQDSKDGDDVEQGPVIRIGGQSSEVLVSQNLLGFPAAAGIAIRDDGLGTGVANVDVLENQVLRAEASGLDVTSPVPGVVEAFDNLFRDNEGDGISLGDLTSGNVLRRNQALDNLGFDCRDQSIGLDTAGTANTWRRNRGVTDAPDGLCEPPTA